MHVPERIDQLVLLSPVGVVPFRPQYWLKVPALFSRMLIFRSSGSIRKFAGYLAGPTAPMELVDEMTVCAEVFLRNFHMQDSPRRLSGRDLKKITASSMLLVGAHDTFFDPQKVASSLKDNLSKVQTEIVEDTGHVIFFERPDLVNARILAFFDEHGRREVPPGGRLFQVLPERGDL